MVIFKMKIFENLQMLTKSEEIYHSINHNDVTINIVRLAIIAGNTAVDKNFFFFLVSSWIYNIFGMFFK